MKLYIWIPLMFVLLQFASHVVVAAELNAPISPEDKATFDQILTPVMKVYNFVKYAASVVAVIFMLFAGISYMTSGSDIRKRDTAKNIAAYVLIGLFVIWAAPFAVNYLAA